MEWPMTPTVWLGLLTLILFELVLKHLGRLPAKGDTLELGNWRLEVTQVSERRIGCVLLTPST